MIELKERKCIPVEDDTDMLSSKEITEYRKELKENWEIIDNKKLRREFQFDNFSQGVKFANNVAEIAEKDNHHPDICIYFRKVEIYLSTHMIGGLSENDFILAAKIDDIDAGK